MFGGSIRPALLHALTQYDVRQSRGKRYNVYALGQYLIRLDEVMTDIDNGADARAAIAAAFTGPLLSCALKAVELAPPTTDELSGLGRYTYQPAKP